MLVRTGKLIVKIMFLTAIGVLSVVSLGDFHSEEEVKYYEHLIESNIKNADKFRLPTSANMYRPEVEEDPIDFGAYDFVIIGAGATGTVIANRLSEVEDWKILLLEAGDFGSNFTQIPSMNFEAALSGYNWGFTSVPQKTACLGMEGRSCPYPRGKGVGGTTLINGLAYVRGHPLDYDRWGSLGNPGWSYQEVLPYFKKSEDFHKTNPRAPVNENYHGTEGYLSVEYHLPTSPHLEAYLKANQQLGYNLTDYNSPKQIGASPVQQNTKHGRRADGGSAFILPVLHRNNLKVMANSYVIKILIDKHTKKTIGVQFSYNNKIYTVKASKEVIVSAGALSTPHLLMLSGIGPEKHLKQLKIPVVQDLEVGSTLRDHPQYYGLSFASNVSIPPKSLASYIKEYLNGVGPLAVPGPNAGVGFYQSSWEKTPGYPDFELMLISPNATSKSFEQVLKWTKETHEATWGNIDLTSSFMIFAINLHAASVGSVRLQSSCPYDYPVIDSNFLSDPEGRDISVLYEAIQFVLKLTGTEAFKKIGARLQAKPLKACKGFKRFSKEYWYCSLRQLTFNVYHPVGTCPMGPDPTEGAVVDSKLKVHGIGKLRVADASVFPFTLSGHPNAPCVMVGEKAADLIKEEYCD